MASILRSSKFVRYFVSLARNIVINQPREIDGTLIQRSQILASHIKTDFSTLTSPVAEQPGNNIDRSIRRLDQDVRRTGRISSRELQGIFEEIRLNRHATSTQSLMIIRCCGNLVPEEVPEVRTKLVKEIWNTFESLGVSLDISHYNALLRVYLENEHNFSPSEFLAELENKGVEPNRVTFQRLIAAYCQQGDIEGATQILEFMKEKQMPVNESVFNALILGHSQADDMESAAGIMGVMKQANIEPNADTYTALICGYAKRGDMDRIRKLMAECEDQSILGDREWLEVAYTLGVNGHLDLMDEILHDAPKLFGFNQDAKNVALRLVARGKDKAAIKILAAMSRITGASGEQVPAGNFLLKQMVKANRPFETIISLCKELQESKENERALVIATEASLVHKNPDLALKLLSALAEQEEVCQHYFWPLIVQYGKAGDRQGILRVLKQMSLDSRLPVTGETLRDYVIQYMGGGETGIHELRQAGISMASAAVATVTHLLQKKNMKAAARIALQYRANYNSIFVRRALIAAYLSEKDIESLVILVQIMEEGNSNNSVMAAEEEEVGDEAAGKILVGLASQLRSDRSVHITQILQKYLEQGIGISHSSAEMLQNKLSGDELTTEISTLLSKLTSQDLIPMALNRPSANKMFKVKDENAILNSISAMEAKGESVKGLQRQLLTLYCHNKELDKATKLKEVMDHDGYDFNVGLLSVLLDLYAHCEKLPEAMETYKEIFVKDPKAQIDESKLVKLATILVKNDRISEAIELFKKEKIMDVASERGFTYTSGCWKLLNSLAEKGDIENLNTLFDVMKSNHYLDPNNVLLGPLIKVHILKDDVKGALDKFEECCSKYNATPWKNEIACKLIQNEDAVALQRLTDLSTQIHGEVNSLYDLVLSFVECGRIRQARKILETPGLRLRSQRINSACERYLQEGRVKNLEGLIEATKDINHIDRAEIYQHLLFSYIKNDEVDKALGLWTQMQDEDVQPTDEFLSKLAGLLKKHGRQVPFSVPVVETQSLKQVVDTRENIQKKKTVTAQAQVKALRRAVYNKDLDEALKIKDSLKDSDLQLSDRSSLLNALVNSGRMGEATRLLVTWLENGFRPNIRSLGAALNNIAKTGDIDSFNAIGKFLNEDIKKMVSYVNRYTHCMVEAGRAKEVLNTLETDIDAANTPEQLKELSERFPRGGVFSIFQADSDFIPEFEKIAEKYRMKGLIEPTNILWIHYTIIGDKEKADNYWSYLKSCERLMFQPLMRQAREKRDIALAENLLNTCKQSAIKSQALAVIYSCVMDVLLLQDRVEECARKLDEALNICTLDDMKYTTLVELKKAMEYNNLNFKYTIPPKRTRLEISSSSSSSDSDSDTPKQDSK